MGETFSKRKGEDMSTPARAKHKINRDEPKNRTYNHGKGAENYNKVNAFAMSDKLEDWMFSPVRKHDQYKALF